MGGSEGWRVACPPLPPLLQRSLLSHAQTQSRPASCQVRVEVVKLSVFAMDSKLAICVSSVSPPERWAFIQPMSGLPGSPAIWVPVCLI